MNCPICNKTTKVIDTRLSSEGTGIRRRRECTGCEYRFSTVEEVELMDLTIVKRNGKRESYSRDKLRNGILKALEKRPYTDIRLKKLMSTIERDIQRQKVHELTSAELGEVVMNRLSAFDNVAYIRFASVYRQFEDVKTFQEELDTLLRRRQALLEKGGGGLNN